MPAGPQRYRAQGRREGVNEVVLTNALAAMQRIRGTDPRITPVLTLRHLAELVDVPFLHLRDLVGRRVPGTYKVFYLRKRVPGRTSLRMISVPNQTLLSIQRWILGNILRFTSAHDASYAFHPGSRPIEAAEEHCGCAWLLKVDLHDFFHTISEGRIAEVFTDLGFNRLLGLELARLVTVACERPGRSDAASRWPAIPGYQSNDEGMLPQGAPTSPMLSNLVMFQTDEQLARLARTHGMRYSRYADDLAFSCDPDANVAQVRRFKRQVLRVLNEAGFRPNLRKTVIRGPGSRRIVLGMLVDGDRPRLPREFKDMIRLHLYYLRSPRHGPSAHATARRTSVSGVFHHVRGLISWAETVEPVFGSQALAEFRSINWPPLEPEYRQVASD
jgi:hypothetical protein